jgi:hypothetical protein
MLWYDQSLQAHTTKWTGFVSQPSQDGDWLATYGPLSFISVRPVTATSGTSGGGGVSPWVWVALAVILVAIVVVVVVMRSRRSEEDEA